LRAARGQTVAAHARELAALWAGFSDVAATNPDAWRREAIAPELLSLPSAQNPMYAAPYTRWHCSQWNVDQAAAFVVCSAEEAERAGVARELWVFPMAAVESNAMVPLSQRVELHRSPAVSAGGEQLAMMSGTDPRDADHFDLYSCFPSAVQVQAEELRLGSDRRLTVTGGMAFAGGPLDNYNFQALAKMVEVLREQPGTTGLVTCISGMLTKHGMALWSTRPPAGGFRLADVSDATRARTAVRDLAPNYEGPAHVDGYTVVHGRTGEPERAIVVATTRRHGGRAVAATTDTSLAAAMLDDEWCGREVQVTGSTFH
jgi:acetyl-CoA C-acetyltransferase